MRGRSSILLVAGGCHPQNDREQSFNLEWILYLKKKKKNSIAPANKRQYKDFLHTLICNLQKYVSFVYVSLTSARVPQLLFFKKLCKLTQTNKYIYYFSGKGDPVDAC